MHRATFSFSPFIALLCVLVPSGLGVPSLSGGGVDVGEACVLYPSADVVPKVLEGGGVQERGPAVCGGPVAVVGPSADVGFDLNMGLEEAQEELSGPVDVLGQTVFEANMGSDVTGLCAVLGAADGWLNKVLRESEGNMGLCRGVPKFIAPLRKSLLCNPTTKVKTPSCKKPVNPKQQFKKNVKGSLKGGLTVEEKATTLLLRSSGLVMEGTQVTKELHDQFGEQFIEPISGDMAQGLRSALGITVEGAGSVLDALLVDAEE
jgi:hypothetical protein